MSRLVSVVALCALVSAGCDKVSQSVVVNNLTSPSLNCPSSINYEPSGGSLVVGQFKQLKVVGWPTSTSCIPFWYVDRPSVAQITGADTVTIIDGRQYYAGLNAVLRPIWVGQVSVCIQTSITVPVVKQCYNWTVSK